MTSSSTPERRGPGRQAVEPGAIAFPSRLPAVRCESGGAGATIAVVNFPRWFLGRFGASLASEEACGLA